MTVNEKRIIKNILAIEAECKKRPALPINTYNKTIEHKKQMEFHRTLKRNRWVFGGNRSGKTECGAVETAWLLRGIHPFRKNIPDINGWAVSLSYEVQRDVAQAKLLKYLDKRWIQKTVMHTGSAQAPEYGVIDYILVKNVFGGLSRLGFKSCEASREKFQGVSLDFVWFDEEPPKDIYEECRMRLIDRRGMIFGTMTPLKGLTFVHELIYLNPKNDPEVWCTFMEWGDNPFLSAEEISTLTAAMGDDELSTRRYGRFASHEGLVYPEFDPAVHVIDPFPVPYEWQDSLSIDPGLNNPLSCHWYAVDFDGNVYAVAEHYEAKRDITYHASKIKEISARLNWHTDSKGRITALIDSAANQRTLASAKSVTDLFYDEGILVNTNVDKDLYSGISRVKRMLKPADGAARLFIFNSCPNLIREFKGYRWASGDLPRKSDDHALDELRYYISNRPTNKSPEISAAERDRKSLIKQIKRSPYA